MGECTAAVTVRRFALWYSAMSSLWNRYCYLLLNSDIMIYDSLEANIVRNYSRYILLTTASASVGSHIPSFWQMNGMKWFFVVYSLRTANTRTTKTLKSVTRSHGKIITLLAFLANPFESNSSNLEERDMNMDSWPKKFQYLIRFVMDDANDMDG